MTTMTTCMICGAEYPLEYYTGKKVRRHKWSKCPNRKDGKHENIHMPHERYVLALKRILSQIESNSALKFWDDTTIGNKETHCSWGLCSVKSEQWPEAEDHLWPYQFTAQGRVAPLYRTAGQHCPMDEDQSFETSPSGCFYRCKVFQRGLRERDRNEAIARYKTTLALHGIVMPDVVSNKKE